MTSRKTVIIVTLILLGVMIYATTSYEKAKDEKQHVLPVSEMSGTQESYSTDSHVRNEGQHVSRHLETAQGRVTSSGDTREKKDSDASTTGGGNTTNVKDNFIATVTAYSPDYESTGKTPDHPLYKITATGSTAEEGRTVAADFDFLPPGSVIEIEGIGIRIVEDTGGGLSYGHIDLYFETHEQAVEFGTKRRGIKVLRLGRA